MSCCGRSGQKSKKKAVAATPPPSNTLQKKIQEQVVAQQGTKLNLFNFPNRYKYY